MSEASCAPCRRSGGFTLIEVIAALMIFSVGVLMVIGLSRSLGGAMEYAATSSEVGALAQERLDSLEAQPFDSLTVGSTTDSVSVRGTRYARSVTITLQTALLKQIEVSMTPPAGSHPSFTASSYVANGW